MQAFSGCEARGMAYNVGTALANNWQGGTFLPRCSWKGWRPAAVIYVVLTIVSVVAVAVVALAPLFLLLFAGEFALNRQPFGRLGRFLLITLKSLRRNLLRTSLTYLATFVLVVVVVMIWSVLYFLGELTSEKSRDVKIIVTEKYQAASAMPFSYARPLSEGAARSRDKYPDDARPQDSMTWQCYVGTLDSANKTRVDLVFI